MKKITAAALVLLSAVLTSCIANDVPYTSSEPYFKTFEAEGAKVSINKTTRTVSMVLEENADIQALNCYNVSLAKDTIFREKAPLSMEPDMNGCFDFRSPVWCTLSCWNSYDWKITASQTIRRCFCVANQVGETAIDVNNRRVTAYINKKFSLKDVRIDSLKFGPECAVYGIGDSLRFTINYFRPDSCGTINVSFLDSALSVAVMAHGRREMWKVYVDTTSSSVQTLMTNPWAKFVKVKASGTAGADNGFCYREKGASDWITLPSSRIVSEGGVFGAQIGGLTPLTDYEYYAYSGSDKGPVVPFTTSEAYQMPNSGFETTSNADSPDYASFYDPQSPDPALQTKYWDNGNTASAGLMGKEYAVCYSDKDVPAGIGSTKSARLQSKYAVVKLAAGNIFVGEFAGLDGTNGMVNFGRPLPEPAKGEYRPRPVAVRFWYKHNGGKVDYAPAGSPINLGDYDIGIVQIALGNWDYKKYGGSKTSPVQVNTANKDTFWKYEELSETVAYGKMEQTSNGGSTSWTQVTVPLKYMDESANPSFIIISAAASKYGDYFAGYSGSTLWLDEFELLYE